MIVHQVIVEGLPSDFPVLRSTDNFVGNLPAQPTSLVGRDELIEELADALRTNALVTLTGLGGVGKTRLALEIAAELAAEFRDGVWLVELAAVGDPASVPAAIAAVLGITPRADESLIETIAQALGGRQLLLVVDNCEHLLGAAATAIATILARAADVTVLATSREIARRRGRDAPHDRAAEPRWRRVFPRGHAVRRARPGGAARFRPP